MLTRFREAGLLWPTIATAIALSILLGLGTWQWNRKVWKEELIATIQARSKAAPVDYYDVFQRPKGPSRPMALSEVDGSRPSWEYLAVKVTGTFDHANERHVYTGIARPAGGGVGGQGYWIMTPFKIAGSDEALIVSRGFVPEGQKDPKLRSAGQIEGETTIVGLLRVAEPRATFTGANDASKNMWYLRNPAELFANSTAYRTQPGSFIDHLAPTPPGGLPASTAGRIDIPNRHLEYALTWWGLGLTLIGVYAAFAAGRLKSAPKA